MTARHRVAFACLLVLLLSGCNAPGGGPGDEGDVGADDAPAAGGGQPADGPPANSTDPPRGDPSAAKNSTGPSVRPTTPEFIDCTRTMVQFTTDHDRVDGQVDDRYDIFDGPPVAHPVLDTFHCRGVKLDNETVLQDVWFSLVEVVLRVVDGRSEFNRRAPVDAVASNDTLRAWFEGRGYPVHAGDFEMTQEEGVSQLVIHVDGVARYTARILTVDQEKAAFDTELRLYAPDPDGTTPWLHFVQTGELDRLGTPAVLACRSSPLCPDATTTPEILPGTGLHGAARGIWHTPETYLGGEA